MNIRLTILLIVVLLLFGGTVAGVVLTRNPEPKQDQDWLWRIDDNSLTNIVVTYQGDTVEYRKKPGVSAGSSLRKTGNGRSIRTNGAALHFC